MKWFIFTIWVQDDGGYFGPAMRRTIIRRPGRVDLPNHEDIKAYVIAEERQRFSQDARVEFGPISVSKHQ